MYKGTNLKIRHLQNFALPSENPQLSLYVIIYQVVLIHGTNLAASNDTTEFKPPGQFLHKAYAAKRQ